MLLPGPAPQPSAAPSDAGDNPPWNSYDESDFLDHEYSPPSPMSHYPGSLNPLVGFLSHIPDWNSFDKSALDHTTQGLPVPIPGPSPQGISLQEARSCPLISFIKKSQLLLQVLPYPLSQLALRVGNQCKAGCAVL